MERRAFDRINVDYKVNFFHENKVSSGTVTNLSENGMCIETDKNIPCGSRIQVFIFSQKEVLRIPATVKRLRFNLESILGVEILSPSKEYVQFVSLLKKKK